METLRLDFHMGRVECVTCHVPCSHSREGGVKEAGWGRAAVVGGRRMIMGVGAEVSAMAYESKLLSRERGTDLRCPATVEL